MLFKCYYKGVGKGSGLHQINVEADTHSGAIKAVESELVMMMEQKSGAILCTGEDAIAEIGDSIVVS